MMNAVFRMRKGRGRSADSLSPFCSLHPSFCIRRTRPAFTLLELVLVMTILAVLLAMVAPSMSGFGAGRDADYAAAQVVTLLRWAREQAIAEGRVYRINYNASARTYWVTAQAGGTFEAVPEDFGREYLLPDNVAMAWDAPQNGGAYVIDFFPSGRAQPVRIRVTARNGQVTFIGNRSAAELPRVLTPEEVAAG